ncbi:hypothetical protein LCGC14_0477130 [marine sediment metagenome]|uniref:Uncharacterized protein n=1 Tax=marine sediment metagenome TaxID=412755 RepID=A0A0F9UXI1_9ZZZZ
MDDNGHKENSFVKDFDKCPGCSSTEMFFKGILDEVKARGLIDEKVTCFDFQMQQGITLPEQKIAQLPFGSEIPSFVRAWDICCGCGMIVSTHLEIGKVRKSLELPQPNRAERRRIGNMKNPLLS